MTATSLPRHSRTAQERQRAQVSVRERQRLTIHRESHNRVTSIAHHRRRKSRRPAVDRTSNHLRCLWVRANFVEEFTQRDAHPSSRAHELPADLVGNARQRDLSLDEFSRQQVFVRVRTFFVDHSFDGQLPLRCIDPRHNQRRVNSVELAVRREERRCCRERDCLDVGGRGGKWFCRSDDPTGSVGNRTGRRLQPSSDDGGGRGRCTDHCGHCEEASTTRVWGRANRGRFFHNGKRAASRITLGMGEAEKCPN